MEKITNDELIRIYHRWCYLIINKSDELLNSDNKEISYFKSELSKTFHQLDEYYKDIDFKIFSINQLKELGFSLWDENLILAPKWIFQFCKDGTEFVTINGSKKIKGIDHIDMDTRFGTTPNGFLISELKIEERDQKISEIFE